MIYTLENQQIELHGDNHFIAPNATLIGAVQLHDNVSIWFNAAIRADNHPIVIGADSNIQDGAVLPTATQISPKHREILTFPNLLINHQLTINLIG